MKEISRIPRLINAIRTLWYRNPSCTFLQLMCYAEEEFYKENPSLINEPGNPFLYLEDDDIIRFIEGLNRGGEVDEQR